MSEQILLQPIQASDTNKAQESLEKAMIAHEKYLIRQQNSDLQEAIDSVNKYNEMISNGEKSIFKGGTKVKIDGVLGKALEEAFLYP